MKTPFLGGHSVARSLNLADNQCVNLYPEFIETKDGKEVGALYATPGLTLANVPIGSGPIRGIFSTPQNDLLIGGNSINTFVVSGSALYGVGAYGISYQLPITSAGVLFSNIGPVSMIANGENVGFGSQLAIFDGQAGYLFSVAGFSTISLPFTGGMTPACYQDGFGLIGQSGTNIVWQSNLGDLSAWSALTFQGAGGSNDWVVSLATLHREVWVFKQRSTEVWVDNGTSPFAFGPLPGVFLHQGCAAPYSVARSADTLIWLSSNDQGQGMVLEAMGYQAKRVSTHSIETIIAGYSTISDAIAYTYQQAGHDFYVITFPTANATWCYDRTTGLWHQRGYFYNGQFGRHLGNCYSFCNGQNVVGDYATGNLYTLDPNQLYDNGQQRKFVRSWRAMQKPSMQPTRFTSLTIDMQTGVGVPSGVAPQLMLRWSDDGGHKWSRYLQRSAGKLGEYGRRVKFNALGSTRRQVGLDRIFELSTTDPFGIAFMGAEIE